MMPRIKIQLDVSVKFGGSNVGQEMNQPCPDNYHGYGHSAPSMPSIGCIGEQPAMARVEYPTVGYQMLPYQLVQPTSGIYSQGAVIDQQSNNPYTMGSYGNYTVPVINPSMVYSRQGDLTRINGGHLVSPNYSLSLPPDAHAALLHGALNSQPSSYSHSQPNPHMQQQQPQLQMDVMPNQGHQNNNQLIHGQGSQHAHSTGNSTGNSTGHSLPQVGPHQSSGGYGSQSSLPMIPQEHHVPQHPMKHTSTQQKPQEVADTILPMASSYPLNHKKIRCLLCGMEGHTRYTCPKSIHKTCKETQTLATEEKELEQRLGDSDLQALLDEKKEPVEELMKEGEMLNKLQLQSNTIIKKLRAKEKENETIIAAQKKKLDEQTKELERLITVLDLKEEKEKKQAEAINEPKAAAQRQEKELIKHKSDLEDAQEKVGGLQTALDNSYKEIAELHDSNASQNSKAQEAALSADSHVREELKSTMKREQQRFMQAREAFIMQIADLRLEMSRLEKEHSRREDLLRQEIAHLQERLQQDEARSQDLTNSETSAMQPLLRQIENLQATLGAQSAAWERVEKNLTDRLAQIALTMAQEKEKTANDQLMELSARVASLEAANSRIKQEKAQLAAQVESDRSKLEDLQDIKNSVVAQLESSKQRLNQALTQLKMDKHAHSTGHSMPQVGPHQSSDGYKSQSSPPMMPREHHVPQDPMRDTSTQQNPQEVADTMLPTASSYSSNQMSDLEDALEKVRGLQTAVDNSYKEITEPNSSNASQDSKAQETVLSAETQVKEEQRFGQEQPTLILQNDDLRLQITIPDKYHSLCENTLRINIHHVQKQSDMHESDGASESNVEQSPSIPEDLEMPALAS